MVYELAWAWVLTGMVALICRLSAGFSPVALKRFRERHSRTELVLGLLWAVPVAVLLWPVWLGVYLGDE